MQDPMYDKLRELANNVNAESIDQLFENRVGDDEEEQERREREYYRSLLEPKYVVVKNGGQYEFRARYTDYHRSMLSYDEIRTGRCDGGGFWGVDGETKRVTLYDSSSDFGRPKNIEAAIRQDGAHLLELLGRECDKSGEVIDLSDYTITYVDAIGHRHVVEPPYNVQPEIVDTPQMLHNYAGAGITASVKIKRPSNYTPPSAFDRKKRKAKAKAQKQSRRKNRRN